MFRDTLHIFQGFIVLLLLQVLVLGRIHLFGCATPLVYVYMVISFPRGLQRWQTLLWAFGMGLLVDIFSTTPGVASASLTLLAAVQPFLVRLFAQHESSDEMEPSVRTMGITSYAYYMCTCVALFCVVFFCLESFHLLGFFHAFGCIVLSTVLTSLLIMGFEFMRSR